MPRKNDYLESRLGGSIQSDFKSAGERKIAYFLSDNLIDYRYEPGTLVNTTRKRPRIWYPDFYLPEFKSYIEYFGVQNDPSYAKGIKFKESVYRRMGMDVTAMYPWMFKENWQGYLMRELKRNAQHSYRKLMSKPYWSKNRIFRERYSKGGGYHRSRQRGY